MRNDDLLVIHSPQCQCDIGTAHFYRATAYNAMHGIALTILSDCLSHAWIVTKLNDALQIF